MTPRALYGTDQPAPEGRPLRAGPATVTLEDGQLRHLRLGDHEAIRGVMFLVRDRDWGTVTPRISALQIADAAISYRADYDMGMGALSADVTLRLTPGGLDCHARATGRGTVWTNRAGFTLLHPIDGVADAPVIVDHADGSRTTARMPRLIAPWQPFCQITGLTHQAGPWRVVCRLSGDVFEMEDQRQWGDASFKTYNRPLALPWPYPLPEGPALDQRVVIRWQRAATTKRAAALRPVCDDPRLPRTALALTAAEARRAIARPEELAQIAPQHVLCHLDAGRASILADLDAFAALQDVCTHMAFDLELIAACPPLIDPLPEMQAHASALAASGLRAASVMVTPEAGRQSVPPGSPWPPCPPASQIIAAARQAFGALPLGGGVASFFPELNRKRPPPGLDFVTHGLCPIVHAADDLSVIETLEAVPHILASAQAIIGRAEYRIGPASIAMRQNPYGRRTIPNPDRRRLCMTDDDPRQDGAFAAAYALGLATALAPGGVSVWTPAALYGPRGLIDDRGRPRPVAAVVAALARLAGRRVRRAGISAGHARLVLEGATLSANLTPAAGALPPYGWRIEDLHPPASHPR